MNEVGLVGVGYVGTLFLDSLLDAGYAVTVFDVADEQVDRATDRGATAASSPAAVARASDAVVLALPGSPEVEATMEGPDGLLEGLAAGSLVVDATTTLPETSVACEAACEARDVRFLEAPLTGAAPREGYQMMVGGREAHYEAPEASALLDVLCDDHVRVGEAGRATVLKLTLQLRYAGRTALDAELVEFARDNGVDPGLLVDFLGMDVPERLLTREFEQAIEGLGGLAIWHKDVGYAQRVAAERGTALPLGSVVHDAYEATARRAGDEEGHAATILRHWERLNDAGCRSADGSVPGRQG
jgi:3-hydroxyisobutyrate dehydrogenase-like beta-hydroxyacid dehydrogenase